MRLVVADIGGTHARFAIAEIADRRVAALGEPVTLRTREHDGLGSAWAAFAAVAGPLPRAAAFAIAGPVGAEETRLTNSGWTIRPATLAGDLGLDRVTLVNDFAAVAHAVAHLPDAALAPLCGPDVPLPRGGVTTVCGPGTGLGVAQLVHGAVVPSEGGHIGFAPTDEVEDAILARLRRIHGRVSAERVCAGSGIEPIYRTLAELSGDPAPLADERAIWAAALDGDDPLAAAALDRFCRILGAVAGDLALAQGASGVAIAGGLGLRLRHVLPRSGFAAGFTAKGRFAEAMRALPVRLVTHPQPGLYGAAAAFAEEHG